MTSRLCPRTVATTSGFSDSRVWRWATGKSGSSFSGAAVPLLVGVSLITASSAHVPQSKPTALHPIIGGLRSSGGKCRHEARSKTDRRDHLAVLAVFAGRCYQNAAAMALIRGRMRVRMPGWSAASRPALVDVWRKEGEHAPGGVLYGAREGSPGQSVGLRFSRAPARTSGQRALAPRTQLKRSGRRRGHAGRASFRDRATSSPYLRPDEDHPLGRWSFGTAQFATKDSRRR